MKKIAIMITLLLVISLPGCNSSNQKLAQRMIEKYSDNQSYVTLSGVVMEFEGSTVLVKCEELNTYISYEDELCYYCIYSNQSINLSVGDQIDFVTVPFHFYNGHRLPIVELKIDEKILLTFEEGKENLINYVNQLQTK